jgi:hypothetical protein
MQPVGAARIDAHGARAPCCAALRLGWGRRAQGAGGLPAILAVRGAPRTPPPHALARARPPAAAPSRPRALAAPRPPVHVWAPVEQSDRFPYAGALLGASSASPEPPMPGFAELLLREMDGAGVAGALIVQVPLPGRGLGAQRACRPHEGRHRAACPCPQSLPPFTPPLTPLPLLPPQPGNHLYDHAYVASVLVAHPGRFVGCLLADPTPGGGGAAEVERLAREQGFRAVRFNPYLWPEGERMTNEVRLAAAGAGDQGAADSAAPPAARLRVPSAFGVSWTGASWQLRAPCSPHTKAPRAQPARGPNRRNSPPARDVRRSGARCTPRPARWACRWRTCPSRASWGSWTTSRRSYSSSPRCGRRVRAPS